MAELFANIGDPDQMPHSAASDLGLHCLQISLLGISSLQWVKNRLETYITGRNLGIDKKIIPV